MKNRSSCPWHARVLLLGTSLIGATVLADAPVGKESLTLARAIALATQHHPSIAAQAQATEAASSRSQLAALPPNLTIESDFENFGGTGDVSGVRSLEATVQITRVLELGDKPTLRRNVGAAELDRLAVDQFSARLDLDAEVGRRFVQVLSDQAMLETARRATQLAVKARDAARERVNAGAASPASVGRAEIALARAEIEEEHAEHELLSSRMKLAVLWGDETPSFARVEGELFSLSGQESFDAYRARLDASPHLSRFSAELRAEEARVRLAQAKRKPDISLSAGVRRLETFDDQALVASFSVPLGSRQRANLEERAARASRTAVERDRDARRLELHASLFELYQEIVHARTEAESLRARVKPQAEAMFQTTEQGYLAGRFSLLELADAQLQLIEVERESIRAATQFHTLLIDIKRVLGEPVTAIAGRN